MIPALALSWDVAAFSAALAVVAAATAVRLWRVSARANASAAELHASRER